MTDDTRPLVLIYQLEGITYTEAQFRDLIVKADQALSDAREELQAAEEYRYHLEGAKVYKCDP